MNGPLERRLERLEAASGVGASFPVIFVGFGTGEPPAVSVTVNGRVWHRAPGELEDRFLERVSAEARRIRPGVVLGFLA